MNYERYFQTQGIDFSNKTIAITGATGAIGSATAMFVAQQKGNLCLLNRNLEKSQLLQQKIKKSHLQIEVETFQTDFSSLTSIKNSACKLNEIHLDYLILNSGIFNAPRKKGELGFDQIFEINFLMPFLFIKKILPFLKENRTKVIIVGSIAYNKTRFNEKDLDFHNSKSNIKVYGNSKRFLMFSLAKLFERENVDYAICHPGIVQTNLTTHYHKSINWLIKALMRIIFHSPKKASSTTLYASLKSCPKGYWISPRFNIWGKPKAKRFQYKEDEALKMLDIAEKQALLIDK